MDAPVRRVPLYSLAVNWLLAGLNLRERDAVNPDDTVEPGATQVWEFRISPTPWAEHGPSRPPARTAVPRAVAYRGRQQSPFAGIVDSAADDTVLVLPGETVRIQVTFSRFPGLYLYHCHILEHQDMGMTRNFRITAPA